jgi:predicted nucleic acid-binding protein
MIIIADTTPIHYLVLIGEVEVLKELFGSIIIPQAVFDELRRDRTPQQVKDWINSQPQWLEVKRPSRELDDVAKSFGSGEREAIALAIELEAGAILMDDKRAKSEARRRNIRVITILNILRLNETCLICQTRLNGSAVRISTCLLKNSSNKFWNEIGAAVRVSVKTRRSAEASAEAWRARTRDASLR